MAIQVNTRRRLANLRNPFLPGPIPQIQQQARQQTAADLQIQQTLAQMPQAAATTSLAQKVGGTVAQFVGQQREQQMIVQAEQEKSATQLGLGVQQRREEQKLAGLKAGATEQERSDELRLSQLSESAKQEMFDSRKKFSEDELGRKFTNERQLSDFQALTARSDEDFSNFSKRVEIAYDRKQQMMKTAAARLEAGLTQEYQEYNQLLDQTSKLDITREEKSVFIDAARKKHQEIESMQKRIAAVRISVEKEQARIAARVARNQLIGTVVGTAIGFAVGGPAGAAVGAEVGGGLGPLVGGTG